jgi:hypothetical protein
MVESLKESELIEDEIDLIYRFLDRYHSAFESST